MKITTVELLNTAASVQSLRTVNGDTIQVQPNAKITLLADSLAFRPSTNLICTPSWEAIMADRNTVFVDPVAVAAEIPVEKVLPTSKHKNQAVVEKSEEENVKQSIS